MQHRWFKLNFEFAWKRADSLSTFRFAQSRAQAVDCGETAAAAFAARQSVPSLPAS